MGALAGALIYLALDMIILWVFGLFPPRRWDGLAVNELSMAVVSGSLGIIWWARRYRTQP
jgi:hypothetical protein